jgi:hypothetical protein
MLKRETARQGEGEIEIDLIERLWKGTLDRSNQKKGEERRGEGREDKKEIGVRKRVVSKHKTLAIVWY